ncbi:MAG: protease complex subunit PrcB family protein [Gemmatimonadota bacterium]|nr:protease complex subunit PrcB family protein [Gemmatimonadota bacterium]
MNTFVRVVAIAVTALGAACAGSATQPVGAPVPMVRLRTEPYSFTFNSGFDKPTRLVVRDAVTWQAVWRQIYLRESPVPSLPAIDFSQEMIVVAALGSHSTGGYSILLTGASEAASDGIVVSVNSVSPGSNCGVTEAFTQPVDVARLPLRIGPVSFVEQSHVSNCG